MAHTPQNAPAAETDWKKVIVSGSNAEVKSISTNSPFIVEHSIIDFRDLPLEDPGVLGRLWRHPTSNRDFVRVSQG